MACRNLALNCIVAKLAFLVLAQLIPSVLLLFLQLGIWLGIIIHKLPAKYITVIVEAQERDISAMVRIVLLPRLRIRHNDAQYLH